jgi:hypothetical protein
MIYNFTMESADSKFYPGVVRDANPADQAPRVPGAPRVISNHPAPYTRKVAVYVPQQYVGGRPLRSSSLRMGPTRVCSRRSIT